MEDSVASQLPSFTGGHLGRTLEAFQEERLSWSSGGTPQQVKIGQKSLPYT